MMQALVLVIKQSNQIITVNALGPDGRARATHTVSFNLQTPVDGAVEADPYDIWQVTREGFDAVVQEVGRDRIGAVGLVTDPGSALLWESKNSRPVTPLVMAEDRRAVDLCQTFRGRGWDEPFRRRTGRIPVPTASGFKLTSLLAELPRGQGQAADGLLLFGTLNAFLLWRLTGSRVHATDHTDAVHTLLYNLDQQAWDPELLEVFNVPRACLPTLHPSGHRYGETTLGGRLPGPVPISALVATPQAALFGQAVAAPGHVHLVLDHDLQAMAVAGATRPAVPQALSITLSVDTNEALHYLLHATRRGDGAVADWAAQVTLPADPAHLNALARQASSDPNVLFLPARFAPGTNAETARTAAFFGASPDTTEAARAGALLNAAGYLANDLLDTLATHVPVDRLSVSGSLTAYDGPVRTLADLSGRTVTCLPALDYETRGAYLLARHAADASEKPLSPPPPVDAVEPGLNAAERARRVSAWQALRSDR